MDLIQKGPCLVRLYKARIGNFDVPDAPAAAASGDPQELVLEEAEGSVHGIQTVLLHLHQGGRDLSVGNGAVLFQVHRVVVGPGLGEDVAVEIDLFQVREDRLAVLEDGQGGPDPGNVVCGVVRVCQNEVRKVDEGVVVDPAGQVLALEGRIRKGLLCNASPLLQQGLLGTGASELQLFDVIEGIADLVEDPQGDQDIRVQVGVHVGVEVRSELIVPGNVGLDQGLPGPQTVVLGLAHQGLGDGRDGGLALYGPVGIDVGHLGVPQPEDVDGTVGVVDIAGDSAPDHLEAVFVEFQRKRAEAGQVGDEVSRGVVGSAQPVGKIVSFHEQVHNDVFFLIKIKLAEGLHRQSPLPGPGIRVS